MRSISNLFHSIANLAGSINNLAGLIDATTGRLRQQLAPDEALPTVLEHNDSGSTDTPGPVDFSNGNSTKRSRKAS